jgi:hypothetical protein
MLIEDGIVEGLACGWWDELEDPLLKKVSPIAMIFQSIVPSNEKRIFHTKLTFKPWIESRVIVADGGKWNTTTKVEKDHEGNTRLDATVKVQKETESGLTFSLKGGVEARKDKDQKVSTGAYGSVEMEGNF